MKLDSKTLARAAKAAYERFVREAGFQNDARIKDWEKLSYVHQERWIAIASAVFAAGEGKRKAPARKSRS